MDDEGLVETFETIAFERLMNRIGALAVLSELIDNHLLWH
jgi:hypothetical protein